MRTLTSLLLPAAIALAVTPATGQGAVIRRGEGQAAPAPRARAATPRAAAPLSEEWKQELRRIIREEIRAAMKEMHAEHMRHAQGHDDDHDDDDDARGEARGGHWIVWRDGQGHPGAGGSFRVQGLPGGGARTFTFTPDAPGQFRTFQAVPAPKPPRAPAAPAQPRARMRVHAPVEQAQPAEPAQPAQPRARVMRAPRAPAATDRAPQPVQERQIEVRTETKSEKKSTPVRRITLRGGDGEEPRILKLDGQEVMVVVEPPDVKVDVDEIKRRVRTHLGEMQFEVQAESKEKSGDKTKAGSTKPAPQPQLRRRTPGVMV